MFPLINFVLFVGVSLSYNIADLDKQAGPVAYVSLLYRHGERTPGNLFPNDPYNDLKYWPEGFGQLTNAGKLHQYRLGQYLRSRYYHLLKNGRYNFATMCTLSTDYDRTLMSAAANLAGMFPPSEDEKLANINWQPLPVHSMSLNKDDMLAMEGNDCKSYTKEEKRFRHTKKYKQLNNQFTSLYNYLTENTNQSVKSADKVRNLYSAFGIEEMAGLKLPSWAKKVYPEEMMRASDLSYSLQTYTDKMKRLRSGPLLKNITLTFDKKINSSLPGKCLNITAYSAHGDVLANFMNTIGVFNKRSPPFSSLLLIELRKNYQNKYFITVLYKNQTDPFAEPFLLNFPYCATPCPYDKFKNNVKQYIPENWEKECHEV